MENGPAKTERTRRSRAEIASCRRFDSAPSHLPASTIRDQGLMLEIRE
jgi:hypothetical protein